MPTHYSLLSPLRDVPIAVVDVETTGASVAWGDRVIEIGIARIANGRVAGEYQQLVDPKRRISPGITALTGIAPDMCAGQPQFADILPCVRDMLGGAVVMGHNVQFDLSFIGGEFRRARSELCDCLPGAHVLDTVRIARRRLGRGGNGLQRLAARLGVVPTTAHRALADCHTTAGVFERLIEPIGSWNLTLADTFVAQGGVMSVTSKKQTEAILPLELEEAMEQRGVVEIDYLDASYRRTTRLVEPVRLKKQGSDVVLVAHCRMRNELRHFKLDRIVKIVRCDVVS